ncbi:MAG: dihydrolipoyl dehydrogenase [Eubacteriales bacterium]|nr:dihydrolipoyl dehydrogenase [Eubacteriales bacterium]
MVDLIIIGSGPGGYEAAIRAAQNGLSVQIFESKDLGGTCLNRGCIPTKALLHAGEYVKSKENAKSWGIEFTPNVKVEQIYNKKDAIVGDLRNGIAKLLQKNKVEFIAQRAQISNGTSVVAEGKTYEAKNIIIATGSSPAMPPIEGLKDNPLVLNSDAFLAEPVKCSKLAILGGGVIGVELASFCLDLGMQVSIIEAMPRILPMMDKEISIKLTALLKKQGAEIITNAFLEKVENTDGGLTLYLKDKKPVTAEKLLVAVGRRPNTNDLFLDKAPEMTKGYINVDEKFETSLKNIYAIGDVIGKIQLAHTASAQGLYVADLIGGKNNSVNLDVVPSCVYTSPEIAVVGLTQEAAKEKGIETVTGKYLMGGNGRMMISDSNMGFVKVVAEASSKKIIGAQLMCERASDMVDVFTQAIANQSTVHDLLKHIRPHPTFVEGLTEALENIEGRAIHI